MDNTLKQILDIQSNNQFLHYIVDRVQRDNYRGIQISEHNRYTLDQLIEILKAMHQEVGAGFLSVPLGDISDDTVRDSAKNQHPQYDNVVGTIKEQIGKTTHNSLKKNLFVDFARMGFIDRFDKNKNYLDPYQRGHIHYVKLTEQGIKIIQEKNINNKYALFAEGLDMLMEYMMTDIVDIIYGSDYIDEYLTYAEFQYILSDITKSGTEKIQLLNAYRDLKKHQRNKVDVLLQEYCNPKNFQGTKKDKRDYHNWKNETQQIMHLLQYTLLFNVRVEEKRFALNRGQQGQSTIFPKKRRQGVKDDYFQHHNIKQKEEFHLHHIIPFGSIRNQKEFLMIDHYKNLIYLERKTHREIRRGHLLLSIQDKLVSFKDIYQQLDSVKALNGTTTLYKDALAEQMVQYNKKLLKERFDYEEK